jgi:hypothetical protein
LSAGTSPGTRRPIKALLELHVDSLEVVQRVRQRLGVRQPAAPRVLFVNTSFGVIFVGGCKVFKRHEKQSFQKACGKRLENQCFLCPTLAAAATPLDVTEALEPQLCVGTAGAPSS